MTERMFDSDATWAQQFDRAVRAAEAGDLTAVVDFSKIRATVTGRFSGKQNPCEEIDKPAFMDRISYCAQHDWRTDSNTPCYYCERDKQWALTASHTPKQKNVICQHCGIRYFRFWGDGPYTCKECLPTEQHFDNLAEFMKELEN